MLSLQISHAIGSIMGAIFSVLLFGYIVGYFLMRILIAMKVSPVVSGTISGIGVSTFLFFIEMLGQNGHFLPLDVNVGGWGWIIGTIILTSILVKKAEARAQKNTIVDEMSSLRK